VHFDISLITESHPIYFFCSLLSSKYSGFWRLVAVSVGLDLIEVALGDRQADDGRKKLGISSVCSRPAEHIRLSGLQQRSARYQSARIIWQSFLRLSQSSSQSS